MFSCSDELDFDQLDDLQVTPELVSSIIFIEVEEFAFSLLPTGMSFTNDFAFEAFNEDLFARRVISGVITYEIVNTTSLPLDISFVFLDENGDERDSEVFNSLPGITEERKVSYGPLGENNLDIITNTTKIGLRVENRGSNVNLSGSLDDKITLRSKAEFKVALKR